MWMFQFVETVTSNLGQIFTSSSIQGIKQLLLSNKKIVNKKIKHKLKEGFKKGSIR